MTHARDPRPRHAQWRQAQPELPTVPFAVATDATGNTVVLADVELTYNRFDPRLDATEVVVYSDDQDALVPFDRVRSMKLTATSDDAYTWFVTLLDGAILEATPSELGFGGAVIDDARGVYGLDSHLSSSITRSAGADSDFHQIVFPTHIP